MTSMQSRQSLRRHLLFGCAVVAAMGPGLGGWMALTEIEGAVLAPGTLVVESSVKAVQHPVGGVVAEILARNGDEVRQGQTLLRLDAATGASNLAIVRRALLEQEARRARLVAERDGRDRIEFPALAVDGDGAAILDGEARLFQSRQTARTGQKHQLLQSIEQMRMEIAGMEAQLSAKTREASLLGRELSGARSLFERQLLPVARLTALERDAARLEGERAQTAAAIARTRGRMAETELKILQLDLDASSEVGRELREVEARIGELTERRALAEEQVRRLEIRAPQDGIVHQSTVHTVGGVIPAGETLMQVVPATDGLIVEARVQPSDIDELAVGRPVLLRFSSFDQKTTPEANGIVTTVGADVSTDTRTGMPYYTARVRFSEAPKSVSLTPGMPAEVFISTGARTVMAYLAQPLTDQLARAFRD